MTKASLMTFLVSACLVYIAYIFALYMLQRSYLYFPARFEAYEKAFLQQEDILSYKKDDLEWLVIPSVKRSNRLLVYFHGNGGAAIDRIPKMRVWANAGYDVVLAEYPGYGTNGGKPSEESFYEAGRIIINRMNNAYPDKQLYLYGESIGSGTAVQMATEYDVKALIIEAGFSSLKDIAASKMPFVPTMLLKDKYDNRDKINYTETYLLSIHGTSDRVVPLKFGKKLYEAYNGPKHMVIIEGAGHNDIYGHAKIEEEVIQKLD